MNNHYRIVLWSILIVAFIGLVWLRFAPIKIDDNINNLELETETGIIHDVVIEPVESTSDTIINKDGLLYSTSQKSDKVIQVTDGIKHTVPLDSLKGGGPKKDGIPSIDNPIFINIDEVDFLDDQEPGVAVEFNGIKRFYPFKILVWHEIVNDTFGEQSLLITYCPLCLSGVVFDPIVDGQRVEFGTSGKLWNSNLVMYDRKTNSYWSQILGEAIVGEMSGEKLDTIPSDQMRFGEWKTSNPDGQVLSKKTGATRIYGYDPYGSYYTSEGLYSSVENTDNRLFQKEFVLGILVDGKAKAYVPNAIKKEGGIEDSFNGVTIIGEYIKELDVVRLYQRMQDGTIKRLNPLPNFWFSWVAVHPETELYK